MEVDDSEGEGMAHWRHMSSNFAALNAQSSNKRKYGDSAEEIEAPIIHDKRHSQYKDEKMRLFDGLSFLILEAPRKKYSNISKVIKERGGTIYDRDDTADSVAFVVTDAPAQTIPFKLPSLSSSSQIRIVRPAVISEAIRRKNLDALYLSSAAVPAKLDQSTVKVTGSDSLGLTEPEVAESTPLEILAAKSSSLMKGSDETEDDGGDSEVEGNFIKNKGAWSCMQTTKSRDNKNKEITDAFETLVKRAEAENEKWRVLAYRKAITALKNYPIAISNVKEVEGISSIGPAMRKKIKELLSTGAIRKAQTAPENFDLLELFKNIYGVGDKRARKFIAQGMKSLEDVRRLPNLTKDQQLGLKYYADFRKRIPREECTKVLHYVEKVVAQIDPEIEMTLMGSYRRGSPTSGDLDFILTHRDGSSHDGSFIKILEALKRDGFIIDDLSQSHVLGDYEHGIYKGVCRPTMDGSPGIARRIDILVVPYHQMGAALIYFTGNDVYNRSLRLLANKKGFSLNQKGLFINVTRNSGNEKVYEGLCIASRTEQEIFDALGVPYLPPNERNK